MEDREKRDLEKIIDQYQVDNTKKQQLEKELKSKNSFIKAKLADLGEDLYETSKSKATITYQNRVSMDDEKVIEIIKENISAAKRNGVIKTKEYVDYDVLEGLIYNGVIAAEKLECAQTTKVIATLTVKPLKKKEEEND